MHRRGARRLSWGRLASALAAGTLLLLVADGAQAGFAGNRLQLQEYSSDCPPCGADPLGVDFDLGIATVEPGVEP